MRPLLQWEMGKFWGHLQHWSMEFFWQHDQCKRLNGLWRALYNEEMGIYQEAQLPAIYLRVKQRNKSGIVAFLHPFFTLTTHSKRPFFVEVKENECFSIIEDVWKRSSAWFSLMYIMENISECGKRLNKWNKTSFENVQTRLRKEKDSLQKIQEVDPMQSNIESFDQARKEVHLQLEWDESMWK